VSHFVLPVIGPRCTTVGIGPIARNSYCVSLRPPVACDRAATFRDSRAVRVFPPLIQAAMVAMMSFPQACATWPLDGTPTCTIYINPLDSDLAMGHEISHCTDHDFHSDLPF
jgi:hypothetical protein